MAFIPKGHKYWKRKEDDALYAKKIEQMLPQGEAYFKSLQEATQFLDKTSRSGPRRTNQDYKAAGYGGTFIRKNQKQQAGFYERFTETGKFKKSKQPKANIREFIGKPTEQPKVRIVDLPMNYCPGCDTAINGKFKPFRYVQKNGDVCYEESGINLAPVMEPWYELRLRPGDVIRHWFCGACMYKQKHPTPSKLTMVILTETGPQEVPTSVYETFCRAQNIALNIEAFVKHLWNSNKEKAFIDEYGEDMTKAK